MDPGSHSSAQLLAAIVHASGDAIFGIDRRDRVMSWNPAAEQLFGFSAGEAVGQPIAFIVPTELDDERRAAFAEARANGGFSLETKRRHKNGSLIDVILRGSAVRGPAGDLTGVLAMARPLNPCRATAATPAAETYQAEDVLERMSEAFYALDRAWRFVYINHAAERFLLRPRSELLGTALWDEYPEARATIGYELLHLAMAERRPVSYELYYEPLQAWIEVRVFPSPVGLDLYLCDLTRQVRSETELTKVVADLQAANQRLEHVSAAKSDFISIISHEFRTPLTSIQGFSELIATETLSASDVHQFATTVNQNARRLARMVGDVLDLDRLERLQPAALRFEQLDLNQLTETVVESLVPTTNRHDFVLALEPTLPAIHGDTDLLVRVVTNLLANSVKYSPDGGTITLRTSMADAGVELTVTDQGLGIPEAHLESIFSRYDRVQRPEQQGIEGSGLGLPIARSIVALHGGSIWAEQVPAGGSAFHVVLPLGGPVS